MNEFINTNSDYDEDQIRTSTRLAQSQQANENAGFVFVNWDQNVDEEKKKTSRRVIRSKATAYSHRVAPRGTTKHELSLRILQSAENGKHSRGQSISSNFMASSFSNFKPKEKRARKSLTPEDAIGAAVRANMARKRVRPQVKEEADPEEEIDRSKSISPGPFEIALPELTCMDASMRDPFMTYPVAWKDWYGNLISYWYNVVLPRSTRVIKASPSELQTYTYWQVRSRQQELSEPVLFYTSLFLASGIPVAEGLFPVRAALWLRQKTVEAMQSALSDPQRATSVPVILAVGRIALHEHIYGNRELAHTMHRPAQLRMINMRGGLANMGLPFTTVQLVVWTDALMSAETGTKPYFADVPRQMAAIKAYTPEEAVYVTNFSSPHRQAHPGYDRPQRVMRSLNR